MKIHRFGFRDGSPELRERFLELRESIHRDDYYFYSERATAVALLDYYSGRSDYSYRMLLAEAEGHGDVARLLVGCCEAYDFAFFGFFECPNDLACFRELMEAGCEVARELGARDLQGPIELNPFHGWMFLDDTATDARWVGDPYHRRFYPELFRRERWDVGDRSTSGVLRPAAHRAVMAARPEAMAALERQGMKVLRLGEVPEEDFLPEVWRLVSEAFTTQLHRYVPVDLPVFRLQTRPVLSRLHDPESLLLVYEGDSCRGFCLSYDNFIDRVCDPAGRRVPPAGRVPFASPFSMKTFGVDAGFRGRGVWKALFCSHAAHAEAVYRNRAAWRRTGVRNPGTQRLQADAFITETYVTFRRRLR